MRNTRKVLLVLSILLTGTAVFSDKAVAAGFFIQEQSVNGLGQAFAGIAAMPENASTIFYNPAGLTHLKPGTHVTIGLHTIIPSADLKDKGSTVDPIGGFPLGPIGGSNEDPFDPILVPNIYLAHAVNPDLWVGLGVSSPYGLGNKYENQDFFGRYNSTSSNLLTVDIAPTMAYRVNEYLSVGASANIQYAKADLESSIPDPTGPNNIAAEGFQELEGQDWSASYTVGMIIEPTEKIDVGLNYRHKMVHELDGRLTVDLPDNIAGGIVIHNPGTADLDLPNIASLGVAYEHDDKLTLLGQVNWFGWSLFDDITVDFDAPNPLDSSTFAVVPQGYKNTFSLALGARYDYSQDWTLRGGVQYDETPTQVDRSTLVPDGDRYWIAGGATYHWRENISLDFGATYIHVADETINLGETEAGGSLVNTRADIDSQIGILSVGMNYRF